MRRIRRNLTFANVASAIALFVAVSGGTAVALNGTDTVQSDDLGPGAQVKSPDVADNAVNSADVVNNNLTGADVQGLTGGDVTNDSLSGQDISEATLGKVPNADKLDGHDSAGFEPRRIRFASALEDSATQEVIYDYSATASFKVVTDGDADRDGTIKLLNTQPGGSGLSLSWSRNGGTNHVDAASTSEVIAMNGTSPMMIFGVPNTERLWLECLSWQDGGRIYCMAHEFNGAESDSSGP